MKKKIAIICCLALVIVSLLTIFTACNKSNLDDESLRAIRSNLYEMYREDNNKAINQSYKVVGEIAGFDADGKDVSVAISWKIEGTDKVTVSAKGDDGFYTVNVPDPYTLDADISYTLVGTLVNDKGEAYKGYNGDAEATYSVSLPRKVEAMSGVKPTATITFDNTGKAVKDGTTKITWTEGDITVINEKASSTTNPADYIKPARFYKGSTVEVTYTSAFKALKFNADISNSEGLDGMVVEGATIKHTANEILVTFAQPVTSFKTTALAAQTRFYSIEVYCNQVPTIRENTVYEGEDAILAALKQLEPGEYLTGGKYSLTGEIVTIDKAYVASQYGGSITVTIEVGAEKVAILCYNMNGGADLAVGDKITVTGYLQNYVDTDGSKFEFVTGSTYEKVIESDGKEYELVSLDAPEAGTYQLAVYALGTWYWATGAMDGYYYATSTSPSLAGDFVVEVSGDGYTIKFGNAFLEIEKDGEYYNVKINSTSSGVWKWNDTIKTFTWGEGNDEAYLGVYKSGSGLKRQTLGASNISYVTGSNAGSETNFIAHFGAKTEVVKTHECDFEYNFNVGTFTHTKSCKVADCDKKNIEEACTAENNVCSLCKHTFTRDELIEALFGTLNVVPKGTYSLTGVIDEIVLVNEYNGQGQMNFYLRVDGNRLYVFRMYDTKAALEALKVGTTITVTGEFTTYQGAKQFNQGCTYDPSGLSYDTYQIDLQAEGITVKLIGETEENFPATIQRQGASDVSFKVEAEGKVTVKVNGATLAAKNGVYTFTVAGDTTIVITVEESQGGGEEQEGTKSVLINVDSLEITEEKDAQYLSKNIEIDGVSFQANKIAYSKTNNAIQMNKSQNSVIYNATAFAGRIISIEVTWNSAFGSNRTGNSFTLEFGNTLAFGKTDNSYVINKGADDESTEFVVPEGLNFGYVKLIACHNNAIYADAIKIVYSEEQFTPTLDNYSLDFQVKPDDQKDATQIKTPTGTNMENSYQEGTNVQFKITAPEGYDIKIVTIDGIELEAVEDVYSFLIGKHTTVVITLEETIGGAIGLDFATKAWSDLNWSNSATEHNGIKGSTFGATDDINVDFSRASKQGSTITDRPIITPNACTSYVTIKVANKTISFVEFKLQEWTNKKTFNTITIEYQIGDGGAWVRVDGCGVKDVSPAVAVGTTYNVLTASNLPQGVTAVRLAVGVTASSNTQVGLTSAKIVAA